MLKTIIPLAIISFLMHIPSITTSIMCVNLNSTTHQRAARTALNASNYMGMSVLLGLVTSLECLGSQAAGAGRTRYFGLITARTIIIGFFVSCIITTAWFYSESLLGFLPWSGPDVENLAGDMLRLYSLVLPVFCIDMSLTRYTIILGYVVEIVYVRIAAVILHGVMAYLFIFTWDKQLVGAVLALLVTEVAATIGTVAVVRYFGILTEVTDNINLTLFKGWTELLKLGLPGVVMFAAENLLVGVTLSALSKGEVGQYNSFLDLIIYYQCYSHLYHGLATAGAIITGKNLSKQDAATTKRNATLFCWFSLACGFIFALISLVFRYQIAYFLSSSSTSLVMTSIPIFCAYLVANATQVSMSGVLIGLGKQVVGCGIYLITLCGVGLFATLILVDFLDAGGSGAWLSLALGSGAALCSIWVVVVKTDWIKESSAVKEVGALVDKDCIEMQILGENKDYARDELNINPFTNEVFETVPLFNKQSASISIDTEIKITFSLFVASFTIMIISIIIYFSAMA